MKKKERLQELERKLKALESHKISSLKPEISTLHASVERQAPINPSPSDAVRIDRELESFKEDVERSLRTAEDRVIAKVIESITHIVDEKIRIFSEQTAARYESATAGLEAIRAEVESFKEHVSNQLREIRRDQVCRIEFDEAQFKLEGLSQKILRSVDESNEILEIFAELDSNPALHGGTINAAKPVPELAEVKEQELLDILEVITKFQRNTGSRKERI